MPKILLVTVSEEGSDSLAGRLQCRGFDVVVAGDGKKGIAMAQSEKPDLVLMEMEMPEVDGWEATRQIKAAGGENPPVIALLQQAMPDDRERVLEIGCADYHSKPIEFPDLLAQIESVLQNRPVPEPLLVTETVPAVSGA
jgi:DNA-binding response OmpR family regulator